MKSETHAGFTGPHLELIALSEKVSRVIPPLWPLEATVAVNPFLGHTGQSLAQVSAKLGRIAGLRVTMPNAWYRARIAEGRITAADLEAALAEAPAGAPATVAALKAAAEAEQETPEALPTLAHLAQEVSGVDWPGLIEARIGAWAAGYFDAGQALWQVTAGRGAYESWQIFASRDLTPEISGLTGFAARVAAQPGRARVALSLACDALGLEAGAAESYFHQLLLGLGGWSQLARQRLWQAEMDGQAEPITTDLLTIRLVWEAALFAQYGDQIAARWADIRATHATPACATPAQLAACVLQEAAERAAQRDLAEVLEAEMPEKVQARPMLQAAFCIDVRSEVFRRALESLDPGIQTLGFAGFFGLAHGHRNFASDVIEARLPVLLAPKLSSTATAPSAAGADQAARFGARAARAWGRFKLAAVSSFAFVEATGPVYLGKLLRDALGQAPRHNIPPAPQFSAEFTLTERIATAAAILRAMSLTGDFAPLVLLVGHGARVVNNPHASALHCGACGGYPGDANARLLAGLLNEAEVRAGLIAEGIDIPHDTVFVAGMHDTTTDAVTLYAQDPGCAVIPALLERAQMVLQEAGALARTERALRLPRAGKGGDIGARSTDWAETRPEWGLAGCNAFVAAPRDRTRGKPLGGRAFLHDYDWRQDDGFGVLELILTAPVVVASWISLQYYGSVVAPEVFGAGNKLLHNVTGGVGVVEGNGGTLRVGLPWQSVHDGAEFMHEPLRLTVCVAAPAEAVTGILARHPDLRALFDNRWLHLMLLDDAGRIVQRYRGGLEWQGCREEGGIRAAA
ncbi:YbcC family protein [Roseovarius mucosus]|uniref:YbcC family protein n=1 Tax=Roseovarius mucosus TaxID=215743 RepID=UPI003BAC9DE6